MPVSKRVLVRNHSYEKDFDLHENETTCKTHFHKEGFALGLVLEQRHKRTRKWLITRFSTYLCKEKASEAYTGGYTSLRHYVVYRVFSNKVLVFACV